MVEVVGVHVWRLACLLCWLSSMLTQALQVHHYTEDGLLTNRPTSSFRLHKKHPVNELSLRQFRHRNKMTHYDSTRMPEFVPDGERAYEPDPTFLEANTIVTVHEGDLATLKCLVQHIGAREVSWEKLGDNHLISIGTRVWAPDSNLRISHQKMPAHVTVWNLQFLTARLRDAGSYQCKIIAKDVMTTDVELRVLKKPPHDPVISIEGKEFVDVGQKVYLKCNTTEGDRAPQDVDWFKNGDKIEPSTHENILITKFIPANTRSLVSVLSIEKGIQEDSGTYICRSSTEQIASVEVQVLLADSNNVKRGTGASHTQTGSVPSEGENSAVYFSLLSNNPVLFGLLLLAHYVIHYVHT